MDTAILIAIFIVALYIVARLPGRGAAGGVRTYGSVATARPVKHTVDKLEADALYLWRLRKAGQQASRRQVTRRGEMTARQWNRANELVTHLALDASMPYADGAARIQAHIREQRRLAAGGHFVRPYGDG